MYKFILEIREVQLKLESTTFNNYKEELRKQRLIRIVIYFLFFILMVPITLLEFGIHILENDPAPSIELETQF